MRSLRSALAALLIGAIWMPANASLAGGWPERRHDVHERHHVERGHHRHKHWREQRHEHRRDHRRERHHVERDRRDRHDDDDVAAVIVAGAVLGGIVAILTLGHTRHRD